jgi:hypothetical protein
MNKLLVSAALLLSLVPTVVSAQYHYRPYHRPHPHYYHHRPQPHCHYRHNDNSAAIGLGLGLGILGLMVGGAIVGQRDSRECSNVVTGIDRYGREIRENICE